MTLFTQAEIKQARSEGIKTAGEFIKWLSTHKKLEQNNYFFQKPFNNKNFKGTNSAG